MWPVSTILNSTDVGHMHGHSKFCCQHWRAFLTEARVPPLQGLGAAAGCRRPWGKLSVSSMGRAPGPSRGRTEGRAQAHSPEPPVQPLTCGSPP